MFQRKPLSYLMLKRSLFGLALVLAASSVPAASVPTSQPPPPLKIAELGLAVSTNAALKNLKSAEFTSAWRLGFYAADDSPRVVYKSTNSACSLNSGNGDNGSQIKLADGNCAIADFARGPPTSMIWGALGNGSSDDAFAVQAAVSALQGTGHSLSLGEHRYGVASTINLTGSLEIFGGNRGNPNTLAPVSGFIPLTVNMTVLSLSSTSGGSNLHDFSIFAGPTGIPTAGSWIVLNGNNTTIRRLFLESPCGAIDEQSGNSNIIEDNEINNYAKAGCIAVKIGSRTTGGNTIGTRVLHNVIAGSQSTPAEAGIAIYDSGGGSFFDNDVLYSTWGTKIIPGAKQIVQWSTWTGDQGGDSNVSGNLLIDPQTATSIVEGLQFTGSWSSNASAGPPLIIRNTGGGKINNVHFVGHRFYANGNNDAADILAGINIEFDASQFCLGGNSHTGISAKVGSAVTSVAFRNSLFGNCNGSSTGAGVSATGTGISVASSDTRVTITGNNFISAATPLSLTGNSCCAVISGNQGLDNANAPSVIAAATTITLGPQFLQPITGTAAISTLNGYWPNRIVILDPISAGVNFVTGGNICNALSPARNVAVIATYSVGPNCWTLK